MAGKIKLMVDTIIEKRSKGDELIAEMTKTKLIMKGINPDNYTTSSEDDEAIIEKIKKIAKEMNVEL